MAWDEGSIVQCLFEGEVRRRGWPKGECVVERHLAYFQTATCKHGVADVVDDRLT